MNCESIALLSSRCWCWEWRRCAALRCTARLSADCRRTHAALSDANCCGCSDCGGRRDSVKFVPSTNITFPAPNGERRLDRRRTKAGVWVREDEWTHKWTNVTDPTVAIERDTTGWDRQNPSIRVPLCIYVSSNSMLHHRRRRQSFRFVRRRRLRSILDGRSVDRYVSLCGIDNRRDTGWPAGSVSSVSSLSRDCIFNCRRLLLDTLTRGESRAQQSGKACIKVVAACF